MRTDKSTHESVDEYIAGFPKDVREALENIRKTIRKAAPAAEETISYGIPAFKLKGPLVYFAAHKAHIGLYPVTRLVKEKLDNELSRYESGKATVRFPFDKPIPYNLIGRIVKLRIKENSERAAKVTNR